MQEKPPGYYDNVNVSLLDSIPSDAEVVLEIGCASGALGAEYKKRNPAATYYGVEIDPPSAATAGTRLDRVICSSVDDADLNFLKGTVDCIVYGDVLEHLVDPWKVLKSHRELLKAGGRVSACVPNVQYWALLQHLMHGHWIYQDHGILDITHLRFFTLNSLYAMFAEAGLNVENVIGLHVNHQAAGNFAEAIGPALANLGIDQQDFLRRSNALQYLLIASRQE